MVTLPPADESALRVVTEAMVAAPPDDLVANTGFGIRAWLAFARTWGLEADLLAALAGHTRIAARGPKALGALRSAGLAVWWRAPDEQLVTVGRHLVEAGVSGRRVAVQLHGDDRQLVTAMLAAAGAEIIEIPVYRWDLPPDVDAAAGIVESAVAGTLDAVTFTAGPQVRNLLSIARQIGLADEFLTACEARVIVGCVGPVCAAVATEEGIGHSVVPEQWRLGSLVRVVGEALMTRRWLLSSEGHRALLQGSLAVVDGAEVPLDGPERRLLDDLRQGVVVRADPAVVAGLREVLGPVAAAITEAGDGWRLAPGAAGHAPEPALVT
jgi:uroporphyrinogen-III synthase